LTKVFVIVQGTSLMRITMLLVVLGTLFAISPVTAADDLADGFRSPPSDTRPGCYWYFFQDDVSEEGITKDLEAMARVGIGRAYIGYINQGDNPPGDNHVLSEKWWERIEHTFVEAQRLNIDIGLFNCPGWSQSGGPWIPPQRSMRNLVNTELRVSGPQEFHGELPSREGYFETVKVLAFPETPQAKISMKQSGGKIRVATRPANEGAQAESINALFDDDPQTAYTFPAIAADGAPFVIDFQFPQAFAVQSIIARPLAERSGLFGVLSASDDGNEYRKICDVKLSHGHQGVKITDPMAGHVPTTKARFYRLEVTGTGQGRAFSELVLSPRAMLDKYVIKQLGDVHPTPHPVYGSYEWQTQAEPALPKSIVPAGEVIDITDKLGADGQLNWSVPAGNWVVARFGMVSTGAENGPAMPDATGLECDKMSREHIQFHFEQYIGKILSRIPPQKRRSFRYIIQDSYETGPQNWTDDLIEKFRARFHYDPTPYLPVTTGRLVGSADQSERFLWDIRRLVADMLGQEYVAGITEVAEENGLIGWLENYGHWGFPGEFLTYGKNSTEVGGEFWLGGDLGSIENRPPASCAHVYGKQEVYAEAFTSGIRYVQTPRSHFKHYGDWAFCEGITHFILHLCVHQPRDHERPGVDAPFGTYFTRHNTWYDLSKGYLDYVRRINFMMRRGVNVADFCYFIGDGSPKMDGPRQPVLPRGYDFDFVNGDVILNRLVAKDGRVSIPNGPSYRVVVLPPVNTMRPEIAAKLLEFAKAGVVICGPRPQRSPSLENYPACDEQLHGLVHELWDGGLVQETEDLTALAASAGLRPDFSYSLKDKSLNTKESPLTDLSYASKPQKNSLRFAHRRDNDLDVYFVANMQTTHGFDAECQFRVGRKLPEIWDAVTGEVRNAKAYSWTEDGVRLPMHFEPQQSFLFVFRAPAQQAGPGNSNALVAKAIQNVDGPWTVHFDPDWGGPESTTFSQLISWPDHGDDGVKYYSGQATYETLFSIDAIPETRSWLNLGSVRDIAEVTLNGQRLGVVWAEPWRIETTNALRAGKNELQVKVANTWNNRLLGDQQGKGKYTKHYTPFATDRLLPAGLLGPVSLEAGRD
jgi:hypothetical protein